MAMCKIKVVRRITTLILLTLLFNHASAQLAFTNTVTWKDKNGNTIEAHSGGIIKVGNTYYWIGDDKSHSKATFKGVNCYASTDLVNWEFRNTVISPQTHPNLAASNRIIERPKVIYNDATGLFVIWVHYEATGYAVAEAGVFYCNTIDGNYTFHKAFRPFNKMARDCSLFKDDDGKAYFLASANQNADMEVYRLTPDYLDVEANVATLWPGSHREAPALFKHNGYYFLITSGTSGWAPNQSKYAYATAIAGPWSSLQNVGNQVTFDSQPTYVIPIQGSSQTTFIYCGDRWQDPDLGTSKYIWLPLQVNGTSLGLNFITRWQINVQTGSWSSYTDPNAVDKSAWSIQYASSWEQANNNSGRPQHVYDNNPMSLWHTPWVNRPQPAHPHEVQIDMGAVYTIGKIRLLPRQDATYNGMIKDYTIYTSLNGTDWGNAVASGAFLQQDFAEKEASFTPHLARYVRLVATSEINGSALTSLAELDVIKSSEIVNTVDNVDIDDRLSFYPNPSKGTIILSPDLQKASSYSLYNTMGVRLFWDNKIEAALILPALQSGLYLIQFDFKDRSYIEKVIID